MDKIGFSIRRNCIYCYKPILKKSTEHVIPKSIGGKLIFPLICGKCNNDLGSIVDRHWTWDYWMKFANEQLGLSQFNFRSDIRVSVLQNKYVVVKLPNDEQEVRTPITPEGAWRAVCKMAYELCAMCIGSYIFHNDFDTVRRFITKGELAADHQTGPDSLHFGEWCNVFRTSYSEEPAPWHMFDFQDHGQCLCIHLSLFDYYSFCTTFKVNVKALGSATVKFPFRVVQELHPENRLSFCNWDGKEEKWRIIGCF